MATKTFTLASATDSERTYVDSTGLARVITQNETFALNMTDLGTTASYTGLATSSEMALDDGGKINLEAAIPFTFALVTADGTAVSNAGSLWIVEDDNSRHELHIRNATLDDADAPTTAVFELERRDAPNITFTWTGITVA